MLEHRYATGHLRLRYRAPREPCGGRSRRLPRHGGMEVWKRRAIRPGCSVTCACMTRTNPRRGAAVHVRRARGGVGARADEREVERPRVRMRLANTHALQEAARAGDMIYMAAGSTAAFQDSPFERRSVICTRPRHRSRRSRSTTRRRASSSWASRQRPPGSSGRTPLNRRDGITSLRVGARHSSGGARARAASLDSGSACQRTRRTVCQTRTALTGRGWSRRSGCWLHAGNIGAIESLTVEPGQGVYASGVAYHAQTRTSDVRRERGRL